MNSLVFLSLTLPMLSLFPTPTVAPFPEDHPYNFLNPWIEPWWEQLTKTEQKRIYGYYETSIGIKYHCLFLIN